MKIANKPLEIASTVAYSTVLSPTTMTSYHLATIHVHALQTIENKIDDSLCKGTTVKPQN